VTIQNSDPLANPVIDLGFLTSDYDLESLKEGLRAIRRFAASDSFSQYSLGMLQDLPEDDEDAIEQYIRKTVIPGHHPVGTAAMSPVGADWGVVDPDLRLKGTEGVRVVDASIFPFVPPAHILAGIYAIAERASDIIKEAQMPEQETCMDSTCAQVTMMITST
jgi:choline dehydrogenase-like flavoprotein